MGAIIKPTAYISWTPIGKITVEPVDAYITWLPLGSIEITPKIRAAWLPMGTISVKPALCATVVPGSEKARADTSREVSRPISVTGDTLRHTGKLDKVSTDTARNISRTETADGDTLRRVATYQGANVDTNRRIYLPNGAFVKPSAYISWLPTGKINVKPTDAYITWLPLGTIELTPKICASWVPMGTISIKPMIVATYIPANRVVQTTADTNRRLSLPNEVSADTERKITRSNTVIADTRRQVQSPYIAWATGDLFRKLTLPNTTAADARRTLGGEWAVVHADTQRITGADYQVLRADTWLGVGKTERIRFDTKRTPGIAKVNGVMYEIKGFHSFDSLDGRGSHYYLVGIYAGGKLIHSVYFSGHVSMEEGISESWYTAIPADPKSAYDIPRKTWGGVCEWGFIEDADHWAFMAAVGCSQGRLKGSCMAASLYYYTPEGEVLLGSTSGVMKGMYAPEKSYYDGGFSGIRFPCQDGYYYTVNPIPDVSWSIHLPSIAWVTLYAPDGDVIFADYSIVGRHYSVYRLGDNKYLLGIDDRSIFIASMSTTVGWDPSYKNPDWIRAGLYIAEGGVLEPLMVEYNTIHCCNQRFAKYNKSDKWTENIKEM